MRWRSRGEQSSRRGISGVRRGVAQQLEEGEKLGKDKEAGGGRREKLGRDRSNCGRGAHHRRASQADRAHSHPVKSSFAYKGSQTSCLSNALKVKRREKIKTYCAIYIILYRGHLHICF
jgi:hypothetical protein